MSRLTTSFILGYHGCDADVASKVISSDVDLNPSKNDFDWLGQGVYFWEADPRRAKEYAEWKVGRGDFEHAAVIGAVIDLRNCLDLTNRNDLELVASYHEIFEDDRKRADMPLPENQNAKGDPFEDLLLRYLDCAVINYLNHINDKSPKTENYDTVRGMFAESGELYSGAGFKRQTHTQVAVRNLDCIIGYFSPKRTENM